MNTLPSMWSCSAPPSTWSKLLLSRDMKFMSMGIYSQSFDCENHDKVSSRISKNTMIVSCPSFEAIYIALIDAPVTPVVVEALEIKLQCNVIEFLGCDIYVNGNLFLEFYL